MITVKFLGGPVVNVEHEDGMTVGQMVQGLKDNYSLRFSGNAYRVQDTFTGRVMLDTEILVDGRLIYVNAWIENAPHVSSR